MDGFDSGEFGGDNSADIESLPLDVDEADICKIIPVRRS